MKWLTAALLFLLGPIIRKIIILLIIIFGAGYFLLPYAVTFYLGRVIGTKVSGNLSYSKILTGTAEFADFKIYSTEEFNDALAMEFKNLKVSFDLLSILSSTKIIKSIQSDKLDIHSINTEDKNNIGEIIKNIEKHYNVEGNLDSKTGDYLVKIVEFQDAGLTIINNGEKQITVPMGTISEENISSGGIVRVFLKCTVNEIYDKVKYKSRAGYYVDSFWDSIF